MQRVPGAPSVAPADDTAVYIVLDDFGRKLGRAYRETDEAEADRQSVIDALLTGQFEKPIRVIAFNIAEGWSRDASEDIAEALADQAATRNITLASSAREFFEHHTGRDVPAGLVD